MDKLVFSDSHVVVRWTDKNATQAGFVIETFTCRDGGVWLTKSTVDKMVDAIQKFTPYPVARPEVMGEFTGHRCPECHGKFVINSNVDYVVCPYCGTKLELDWELD